MFQSPPFIAGAKNSWYGIATRRVEISDALILQYHQASQFTYSPKGDREDILLTYDVNTHLLTHENQASGYEFCHGTVH